ncbi:MAG: c-type cytochrome [Acidimicrobiales bacterium]
MTVASGPGAVAPGHLTMPVLAASTVRTIGTVLAVLAVVGLAFYLIANFLSARAEAGSEIELAPNRKPYYDDEQLEGRKLTRTLFSGMALLAVVAIGLPTYWLYEPGRQDGAIDGYLNTFESRGLEQYEEGSQCANCHGAEGVGGQAPFTILDDNGNFVAQVNWRAPALNTVLLRFSREEVISIVDFGRPGTPMPAWGVGGGGPRSEQEIENIVDYLAAIQLTSEEAQREAQVELAVALGVLSEDDRDDDAAVDEALAQIDYEDPATGEAAFNLGQESGFAAGAASCARCHTQGWSIITQGEGAIQPPGADVSDFVDYLPGSGALAPPLSDLVPRQFASVDALAEFITTGSEDGVQYGNRGQGSGRMPGLGDDPNTEDVPGDGMLPREVICAIARYESTLQGGDQPTGVVPTTTTTTSTTTTTQPGAEVTEEEEQAEAEPAFCDLEAQQDAEGEE